MGRFFGTNADKYRVVAGAVVTAEYGICATTRK
jgi:hypothetical protein